MLGRQADTNLLKQFVRGCWDENLISQLHLKEILADPTKEMIGYSDLLFKARSFEHERQLKESRKSRCLGLTSVKARSHVQLSVDSESMPDISGDENISLVETVRGKDCSGKEQAEPT